MSKATDQLAAKAAKLRQALADAEAVVADIRLRLARVEAKLTGEPTPATGLEMLWKAALPMARQRSSKIRCRQAWNRIPASERPKVAAVIDALKKWNRCAEWKRDGNQFVPGLHRWIADRQWENIPDDVREDTPPPSRYRPAPRPVPQTAPEDAVSMAEIAAALATIKMPGRGNDEMTSPH